MRRYKPAVFVSVLILSLPAHAPGQQFVLQSKNVGLDGVGLVGGTNGVAIADYDLDGDLDIYFVVQDSYKPNDKRTWNRLFSNNGDGTFRDVTAQAGIAGHDTSSAFSYMGHKMGASWGDYDNDGYPDLYLTNVGPNQLYHNNGNGTFADVTAQAGVARSGAQLSSSALWFDCDNDGDLDLYVSFWEDYAIGPRDTRKRLYENLGNGLFQDVSETSGAADSGKTWMTVALDVNNDGFLDLFLANDFGITKLYVNNGNKTFQEKGAEFDLRYAAEGMGLAIADCDANGYFDIYLTNVTETGNGMLNPLFLNMGNNHFTNKAVEAGVSVAGWAWGTEFFDYDNDGREDLFVANGYFSQIFAHRFFRNESDSGNVHFREIASSVGLADSTDARGVAVFDYNNDGRQDLLVSNFTIDPSAIVLPLLYENTGGQGHWLKIKLVGTASNRNAFGSVVEVQANGRSYKKYHHGAQFLGQNITPLHFGLGNAQQIEKVIVKWQSGSMDEIAGVSVNQTITIKEKSGIVNGIRQRPVGQSMQPEALELHGNYPNPCNGSTQIRFLLGVPGEVELKMFNTLGQTISVQREYFRDAGEKTITWNANNTQANPLSSGVYYYSVAASRSAARVGKIVYIK